MLYLSIHSLQYCIYVYQALMVYCFVFQDNNRQGGQPQRKT